MMIMEKRITQLINWIHESDEGIISISVGHGRQESARHEAVQLIETWQLLTDWIKPSGGIVIQVVDWPEEAASWLRQAKRFAAGNPDVWVVLGSFLSWQQMCKRLAHELNWKPERCFGLFSAMEEPIIETGNYTIMEGMRGLHPDGSRWQVINGLILPL